LFSKSNSLPLINNQAEPAVNAEQTSIAPPAITSSEPGVSESSSLETPVKPEPVVTSEVDALDFKCKWSQEPVKLFAHSPSKPGDYIHLSAQSTSSACILDAKEKVTVVNLKNQEGQTIRGQQPFQIYSPTLSNFKIFFQGSVVRLPSSNIQNITLDERKP